MIAALTMLDRKLCRDVWRLKTQLLAIMLVLAAGITVFVMFTGMIRSFDITRVAFYERTRFADMFAASKRAPLHVADRLRLIPGVAAVDPRIQAAALATVPDFDEPVTISVQSVPDFGRPLLNDLVLRSGRWIDPHRAGEALVSEGFAEAHGLLNGDRLTVTLNGVRQEVRVVGVVLSPEYVYAIAPGRILPDDARFGVLWMGRRHLAAAYDMTGAFNSVALALLRNASRPDIQAAVDRHLDRYGGRGAYRRSDHPSDRFLQADIDQMRTLTRIVPTIFLLVAAFLLNVVIGRLVALERESIGLLKAFGYTDAQVARHYLKLVLVIIAGALLVGFAAGDYLGRSLAELYVDMYRFPVLYFQAGVENYVNATLIAVIAGLGGAWSGVRSALRLSPAEAMRPPAPLDYGKAGGAALIRLPVLDGTSRMVLRHLLRHPRRTLVTVLGIAMAAGMMTGSRANIDSIERMLQTTFEQAERQDATVTFVEPVSQSTVYALASLPGVRQVEPFRSVAAVLRAGVAEKRQGLLGMAEGNTLNRLIDTDGRPVRPPDTGVLLSKPLADALDVGPGQRVTASVTEGRRPDLRLIVSGVVETYVGTPAYMSLGTLNQAMAEGPTMSGAYLVVDGAQSDALFTALKAMPMVAGVELTDNAYRAFRDTLDESIGLMIRVNTLFAAIIIFGVVYNAARISLSERGRELASMRVLGFTRGEVAGVMLGELAVVVVMALPLGTAFGATLSYAVSKSFSQDLYTIPFALSVQTAAMAALLTLTAALVSGVLVWRRIADLDMIAVLKSRE